MIDRIKKNEERLDNIEKTIKEIEEILKNFKENKKDLNLLKKYYGSKNWFKDKEAYEKDLIPKVKAGVLSEDAIWNLNDDIKDLINEMKKIIKDYE